MPEHLIETPPVVGIPVAGTDALFAVRRGNCVGRYYAARAVDIGRPWDIGKAFERSGPCGPRNPVTAVGHPDQVRVSLTVNDEQRQEGDSNQVIWKVPEIVSYISNYFELAMGDVIMSEAPAGVGAVERSDVMVKAFEGLDSMEVRVV